MCKDRRVYTQPGKKQMLVFQDVQAKDSTCIISNAKSIKYITKGCPGFLVSVILDNEISSSKTANEKIGLDFPDVFLERLSWLLLKSQLEFAINL